jgi:hypothetical protein
LQFNFRFLRSAPSKPLSIDIESRTMCSSALAVAAEQDSSALVLAPERRKDGNPQLR